MPQIPTSDARREYQKRYHTEYQKTRKRVALSYHKDEYEELVNIAKEHDYERLSQFLKDCIEAYLAKGFIVPHEANVRALETELRRIGTNINQTVHLSNRTRSVHKLEVDSLRHDLSRIEEAVKRYLRQPLTLTETVLHSLRDHPEMEAELRHLLKMSEQQRKPS